GILVVSAAVVLLGAYLIVWGLNGFRRTASVWRSDPIPIEETHLADGTVEVEGTAETLEATVSAPYSDRTCLAYSAKKERKERQKKNGEWEKTWNTVSSPSGSVPFTVEDDTGSIAVDPDAATLGMDGEYSHRSGNVKYSENRIDPGDTVHVIGQMQSVTANRPELGDERTYIGDGDETPTFRITDGSEFETVVRMFGRSAGALILGTLLAGGSASFFSAMLPEVMVTTPVSASDAVVGSLTAIRAAKR
ncbi:MAG: GIDE domain-containing protein, partial [Halorubrum sp.]